MHENYKKSCFGNFYLKKFFIAQIWSLKYSVRSTALLVSLDNFDSWTKRPNFDAGLFFSLKLTDSQQKVFIGIVMFNWMKNELQYLVQIAE